MLSIELLESWDISFGHSPSLDEVLLAGVACLLDLAALEDS